MLKKEIFETGGSSVKIIKKKEDSIEYLPEESLDGQSDYAEENLSSLEEVRRVFEILSPSELKEQDPFVQAKKEMQVAQQDSKASFYAMQKEQSIEQLKSDYDYYILILDPEY